MFRILQVAFCEKCKEGFPSRTKLFAHIKATGHASIKVVHEAAAQNANQKKGKKKNKR